MWRRSESKRLRAAESMAACLIYTLPPVEHLNIAVSQQKMVQKRTSHVARACVEDCRKVGSFPDPDIRRDWHHVVSASRERVSF